MNSIPFSTQRNKNKLTLTKNYEIKFIDAKLIKIYETVQRGIKICKNALRSEKPLLGTRQKIIDQIHQKRFTPLNPYLITGGHFSQLYVRNLGIFYNALLDSRLQTTQLDWLHRQQIAVQTIAIDLEIFNFARKTFTTIVPLKKGVYTGVNIYAKPSDSLFAILYTFCALINENFIDTLFPIPQKKYPKYPLYAKEVAHNLLERYTPLLLFLLEEYQQIVFDESTGLIKKPIFLSSARDGIKRTSSFYDNVICWATIQLGNKLGIVKKNEVFFKQWKQHIVNTFWNVEMGIFLDDLLEASLNQKVFSSDSFIVISTGFFNISKRDEREKLIQIINYIKRNKLDYPFPLKYSVKNSPKKLYKPVRYFAPSYMGESIWSHWGMEYIKTLILLSPYNKSYQIDAKHHLLSYSQNIEKYGGYPELYNKEGKMLKNRFYKSVLHNGWVINYEQAKMLDISYTAMQ